jgi:pimeloyl-ACP methyl ester carboxylesterase
MGKEAVVTHRFVEVGQAGQSIRLHVAEQGGGKPVILLHGFPECWLSWRAQMGALAGAGFRAVAPDLRGYNESDKPRGIANYKSSLIADDVAALIRSLGAGPVMVVGHDWGGPIAYRVAMDHPELVSRLVILNGPHPQHFVRLLRTSRVQRRKSWYIFFFQLPYFPERMMLRPGVMKRVFRDVVPEEDIAAYERAMARPNAATSAINYYRAARFGDRRPRGGVTCPTRVVWGMRDFALGPECLDGLSRYVPNVRIDRIDDAGHWVQQESAERVNAILVEEARASS